VLDITFENYHEAHCQHSRTMTVSNYSGESIRTLSRNSTQLSAFLKCLCAHRRNTGSTQEKLEICVQLQGYGSVWLTVTLWDCSHNWSTAMSGYRLFRKGRPGGWRGQVVFYVKAQQDCIEFYLGIGDGTSKN